VAVEPPSPTDGSPAFDFAERHEHSQQWNVCADESRRDLQRTKTMPARRARSSSNVTDGPESEHHHRRRRQSPGPGVADGAELTRRGSKNQAELLKPASLGDPDDIQDAEEDDDVPRSSCRVYRVRSFTTKKGGSVVNRGDSIKICGSGGRRGSQLLITPTNGTDLLGGGLQAPSQPSSLRRRSVTCLTSGSSSRLQPEVVSVGVSQSRRHSFIIRQPPSPVGDTGGVLARRTSLRGGDRQSTAATDRPVAYRVELTLGKNQLRRSSTDRSSGADAADKATPSAENGVDETRNPPVDVEADNNDDEGDDDDDVQVYKVMVLGSHGVGKTTLVQQLLTSEYLANVDDDRGQSASVLLHLWFFSFSFSYGYLFQLQFQLIYLLIFKSAHLQESNNYKSNARIL